MLIKIGATREPSDIVDLLLECHERIRTFIRLASQLASAQDSPIDEVREVAARVTRYFSESLPLHVADEEESVLPRLRGKNAHIDAVLQTMRSEHATHEPQVASLLDTCRLLQTSPERLPELGPILGTTAAALEQAFTAHLDKEEAVLLPAIRTLLGPEEQEAMLREFRARRTS